ncbi:MAG: hypothetical protein ABI693_06555 [Bryobacteraceae bacterium]
MPGYVWLPRPSLEHTANSNAGPPSNGSAIPFIDQQDMSLNLDCQGDRLGLSLIEFAG